MNLIIALKRVKVLKHFPDSLFRSFYLLRKMIIILFSTDLATSDLMFMFCYLYLLVNE